MPRDPHKLMDFPWIWMGHRVMTSQFTHFRVQNLLHSSTRPRCGIRRSDLAIYISCATESEMMVGFFCILGVWFHVSLKSRTLQDPHAAGMSKMDFLFVYFSKLQGGLPRHSRKSLIYCLIKIHLYPPYLDFYSCMLTFHEIMLIDARYIWSNLSEARTFSFIYTDFELSHPDRVILI